MVAAGDRAARVVGTTLNPQMRGFKARPWSKAEKPTPLKTNFTTEPATAPPALVFYPNIQTR
ncbi:hypothetical protein EFO70_07460 [Lacticaseibacillus rhamnosus]|nr:hypothetical protein [Lacticaseibacillus rhamnosus]MCT3181356.1 hypothetical protein [Lacticaseibacillus rhamnosus]